MNVISFARSSKSLLENNRPIIGISFKNGTPRTTDRLSVFLNPPIIILFPGLSLFSCTSIERSVIIGSCATPSGVCFDPIFMEVVSPIVPSE